MRNEFDLINRSNIDNQCISQLTDISEDNLDTFLNERPKECPVLDQCTTLIEQSTLKTLNIYMKKGIKPALKRLDSYIIFCEKYLESGKCCEKGCMDNAIKIFSTLKDILNKNKLILDEKTKDLFSKKQEYSIIDGNEKDDCKLLTPLSNELRLKILKTLSKGGTYYTQLEREVGLKGGHFHFHLDKLIEGGYIKRQGEKGPYIITTNGLKALKFLFDLKQEVYFN